MIDCFDVGFEASAPSPPQEPRKYALLPLGEHVVEIAAASVGDVAWKVSDENPRGQCLRLRLSGGREFGFVFADLPRDREWLFKALAVALGLEPGEGGRISIGKPDSLVGRSARVEISHYTTRAGETRANVKKWLPVITAAIKPTSSTRAPAAPPRTPAAKAAAAWRATAEPDDIPF